jgi:putative sterol carrier protein
VRRSSSKVAAGLTTNSLHELLQGILPLTSAILFCKLKVQGSKSKAMKLENLLHAISAVYPSLIDES